MKMTDEKILDVYQNACQNGADNKKIVIELADANGCDVWEMATFLKQIGADIKLNQFSKFNPKRGGGKEDGGRIEYLKTVIQRQDEEIKRLSSEKKSLEESLNYDEEVIQQMMDSKLRHDEETALLVQEQRNRIATMEQQLEEHVLRMNEMTQLLDERQETPYLLNMSDLINRFCTGLYGVNAYLTGRIVEMLYRWRFAGEEDQLLMLPAMIEELTNLIFDKTEETT